MGEPVSSHWAEPPRPGRRKRIPKRLGWGDYDCPDGRVARAKGRQLFLQAVHDVEPDVLGTLAEQPFATMRRLARDSAVPVARGEVAALFDRGAVPEDWGRFDALRGALLTWADRWHLSIPWCLARAGETLRLWLGNPSIVGRQWRYAPLTLDPAPLLPFTFTIDSPWSPLIMTREQYERELRRRFDAALAADRDDAERELHANGFIRVQEKRAVEHFAWLARYTILGESYSAISRDLTRRGHAISRQSVTHAIQEGAALIDLPLPTHGAD